VVVGMSDEPAEMIKAFLAHDGAGIQYAVAADNERQTAMNYMLPVRQRSVPYAFVVGKDERLLWHGPPQDGLEEALEQITAGKYDVGWAIKRDEARRQVEQYVTLARRNDKRTGEAGRRLLANWTNDVPLLCDLALEIATDRSLKKPDLPLATLALERAEALAGTNSTQVAVTRAIVIFATGKTEEGLARAKEALAAARERTDKARAEACLRTMTEQVESARTNQPAQKDPTRPMMQEYVKLARRNNPQAAATGRELLGMITNDVARLCSLAFGITTDSRIKQRDLALAGEALDRAEKLVAPTNSTLVALMRAVWLFETGKQAEGVARARDAAARAGNERDKASAESYVRTLEARLKTTATNQTSIIQTNKPAAKP
jgi:hypothetical protein